MNYFKKNKIFIIGEIGLNHDGSFLKCKSLIKKAAEAGFDAVKLQISNPDESYDTRSSSYKFFKKYNLKTNELLKLKKIAKLKKIQLFSTIGDNSSLKFIRILGSKIIKISSGLLNNYYLTEKLAKLNMPIIISTGLAYKKEINKSLKIIEKFNNSQIGILVCTSIYPTKDSQVKIDTIRSFIKLYKNKFIGYSDHSEDNLSSYIAAGNGAAIIEKHITMKRKNFGDHKFALEAKDFKKFIHNIRRIGILNLKKNLPLKEEISLRKKIHRYIVARRNIAKGEKFTLENIALKRTFDKSKGLSTDKFKKILEKKSKSRIKKNFKIKINHI